MDIHAILTKENFWMIMCLILLSTEYIPRMYDAVKRERRRRKRARRAKAPEYNKKRFEKISREIEKID